MPGSGDLAEPVSYSPWVATLAAVLPLLVVAWYVGVTLWARGRIALPLPARLRLAASRRRHLGRLDHVRRAVEDGRVPVREGHQQLSAVVRSFVAETGPVDVRTMSLSQLRGSDQPRLVDLADLVELVYPPAFEPGDQGRPVERFDPAFHQARHLVAKWAP
jgi:hypothetical protein